MVFTFRNCLPPHFDCWPAYAYVCALGGANVARASDQSSSRFLVFIQTKSHRPPLKCCSDASIDRFSNNASLILLGISFVMGRHFEALIKSGEIVGAGEDGDDSG